MQCSQQKNSVPFMTRNSKNSHRNFWSNGKRPKILLSVCPEGGEREFLLTTACFLFCRFCAVKKYNAPSAFRLWKNENKIYFTESILIKNNTNRQNKARALQITAIYLYKNRPLARNNIPTSGWITLTLSTTSCRRWLKLLEKEWLVNSPSCRWITLILSTTSCWHC